MGPLPRGRLRAHQRPGRSSLAAVISAHRPRRRALTRRQPACDPAPRRLSVHLMACDRRCRQGGLRPCRSDTEARYHGPPSVSCLPRELRRQAARSPLMPRPPRGHDHTGNCILFIEDGHCPLLADRLLSCRTAICAAQRDGTPADGTGTGQGRLHHRGGARPGPRPRGAAGAGERRRPRGRSGAWHGSLQVLAGDAGWHGGDGPAARAPEEAMTSGDCPGTASSPASRTRMGNDETS